LTLPPLSGGHSLFAMYEGIPLTRPWLRKTGATSLPPNHIGGLFSSFFSSFNGLFRAFPPPIIEPGRSRSWWEGGDSEDPFPTGAHGWSTGSLPLAHSARCPPWWPFSFLSPFFLARDSHSSEAIPRGRAEHAGLLFPPFLDEVIGPHNGVLLCILLHFTKWKWTRQASMGYRSFFSPFALRVWIPPPPFFWFQRNKPIFFPPPA